MTGGIDLSSRRAKEARLGSHLGWLGYWLLMSVGSFLLLGALVAKLQHQSRYADFAAAAALLCYLPALWWKRELSIVPAKGNDLNGRLSVDVLTRLKRGTPLNPQTVWTALSDHWQTS